MEDCEGSTSKGQHMHCPFCPVKCVFTDMFILRAHYRVKHVDKGVDFAGLRILRCSNNCFIQGVIKEEKKFKGAHWHCFRCKNAFNRKDEALKHFKTHFKNPATTFQIQIAQDINQPNIIDMYNKQSGPMSFKMYAKMNARSNLQHGLNSFFHVEPTTLEIDKDEYIISETHEGTVGSNGEIVLITSEETGEVRKSERIIEELQKQISTLKEEKAEMERQYQHRIEILYEEKKLLREQLQSLQQGILSKMPASVLLESQFIARSLEQQFKDFVQFNMSKLSQCFLGMTSSDMTMNLIDNNQEGLYNVTIQSQEPCQEFVNSDSEPTDDLVQNVIETHDCVHIGGATSNAIGHQTGDTTNTVSQLGTDGNISVQHFVQSDVITSEELVPSVLTSNLQQVEASQEFEHDSSEGTQEQPNIAIHQDPTIVLNVGTDHNNPVEKSTNNMNVITPSTENGSIHYIHEEIIDISSQFQLSKTNQKEGTMQKRTSKGRSTPPLTRKRCKIN
ncbi:uncharacterized protein [Antedon mediterranea]